jgi:ketosteroid isomerase-like protein
MSGDELGNVDPVAIVEQWQNRAWGECDFGAVDELVAEPFVRHGPTGTATRTHAELKHDLRQYQRALGTPTITVHGRVADGDRVWSHVTLRGVSIDTGELRTVERLQIHRVVDGRIVEVWSLYATDVEWG